MKGNKMRGIRITTPPSSSSWSSSSSSPSSATTPSRSPPCLPSSDSTHWYSLRGQLQPPSYTQPRSLPQQVRIRIHKLRLLLLRYDAKIRGMGIKEVPKNAAEGISKITSATAFRNYGNPMAETSSPADSSISSLSSDQKGARWPEELLNSDNASSYSSTSTSQHRELKNLGSKMRKMMRSRM